MTVFIFDATEILGYIGGLVLSFALVPQVVHTYRTQSTRDISYGWQAIYITGLVLNYIYFVLLNATAGWVTLTIELFFALFLTCMKLKIDGCKRVDTTDVIKDQAYDEEAATDSSEEATDSFIPTMRSSNLTDLDQPMSEMLMHDAVRFQERSSAKNPSRFTLVRDAYRGFHIMIDAVFTNELPIDFGVTLMDEMRRLAALHNVRCVHHHVETFDGSLSPPGFAAVGLLDESHMTAHCYSDQGLLAFDVFTCGSMPENTRKVARDVLAFLKLHLSADTEYLVHHMPRFPKHA
jgi:S-adenosylmethionine decarboxylase